MRYWDNGHMDSGSGLAMMFVMLGIWVLIAVAVVWVVRSTRAAGAHAAPDAVTSPTGATTNAERILAERLARGDIDATEYRARLDVLRA